MTLNGKVGAGLVAAAGLLLSTVVATPALADPYVGPGGEPRVDGVSGPWRKVDRPRGEESRTYLPACDRSYVCLYVLSNQTSARNYWYVFRLYVEKIYAVHNFNYNSQFQWIINNQSGGVDAETLDGGSFLDRIQCYAAPASAPAHSYNFLSANWYPVWYVNTRAGC